MNGKPMVLALAFLCLAATPAPAQSITHSEPQRIDAIFSAVTSPDTPGLAVLVRRNAKTVFERGYGTRDLRT